MERNYVIPLRREWLKSPKYKRAKKAITAIKEFVTKHMKATDVKIMNELNEEVWKNSIKSPPGKVKVTCVKDEEGIVKVSLIGLIKEEKPEKKAKKTTKKNETKAKPKEEAHVKENKVEKPKVEAKKEIKSEAKPKEETKIEKKVEEKTIKEPEVKKTEKPKEVKKEKTKSE